MYEIETVVKRLKAPALAGATAGAPSEPFRADAAISRTRPAWLRVASSEPAAERSAPVVTAPPRPIPVAEMESQMPRKEQPVVETPETGGGGGGGRIGPVATLLGAAASVALVLGVAVWTYKLGQRDALEVPIVRAMTTPARVPPERPGGFQTAHQGLAVNKVMEGGGVRPVARSVVTAPGSATVTEEDLPLGALRASNPVLERETIAAPEEAEGVSAAAGMAAEPLPEDKPVADDAFAIQDSTPVRPVEEAGIARPTPPALPEAAAPETPQVAVLDADDAAALAEEGAAVAETGESPAEDAPVEVAALPVPPVGDGPSTAPAIVTLTRARPAELAPVKAVATVSELDSAVDAAVREALATRSAAAPADPLSDIPLPKGTRMIQLGAYDSEMIARSEWERFLRSHDDLLGGKEHYVQRTESSGKTYYRLRVAGFADGTATRAACAALSARNVPCISVTLR